MVGRPAAIAVLVAAMLGIGVQAPASAEASPARAAAPCVASYTETVGTDIQTGAADTSVPMDVPTDAVIEDVDMVIDVKHPTIGDVSVVLHRGTGPYQVMTPGYGGDGDGFDRTIFDDEATTPISAGTAPFRGRFVPEDPLDVWDGQSAAGTWYALVKEANLNTGDVFVDWTLTFTFATCDLDGDGVEDHVDSCLGIAGEPTTGCPVVDRSLSMDYRRGAFRGTLVADAGPCAAREEVVVWRVRAGSDDRVGRTTTNRDGRFVLERAVSRGRFYAVAPRSLEPSAGTCVRATSDRVSLG